jgi:pimeloyl-ACP methyl ester carboxylesterase
MHGFPDNHHLYDRLVPYLRGRHVVTFDFLGWGESDKPSKYDYTFANREGDLDAVVNGLGLDGVVLVVHDASGPTGINWALDHPQRVGGIVALNTFYSLQPDVPPKPPEAIRLFSDPNYARLTEHFADAEIATWDDLSPDGKNDRGLEILANLPVPIPPGHTDETPIPPRSRRRRKSSASG